MELTMSDAPSIFPYIFYIAAGFAALVVVSSSFFTVREQSNAVIERFGRFLRIARPGLNIK